MAFHKAGYCLQKDEAAMIQWLTTQSRMGEHGIDMLSSK